MMDGVGYVERRFGWAGVVVRRDSSLYFRLPIAASLDQPTRILKLSAQLPRGFIDRLRDAGILLQV